MVNSIGGKYEFCVQQLLHCRMAGIMRDIRLPGPEGRVVVFGGIVFKLKYKLR